MDIEGSKPTENRLPGNDGTVNRTLALVIFFAVLLAVILAILGGRSLFSPNEGWGQWSPEIKGPCIPSSVNPCQEQGNRWSTSVCIPNSSTGRGCLDQRGMQTFIPKREKQSCNYRCNSSRWKITRGECEAPESYCTLPRGTAGTRRVTMECVSTGTPGTEGCVLRSSETRDSEGRYLYKSYKVGQVVEWNQSCYNYSKRECPRWYSRTTTTEGTRWNEVDGTSRMEGIYIPSSECITGDDIPYSLFEEGLILQPVVCGFPGSEMEGQNLQQYEGCPSLKGGETDLQSVECETRMIMPWQLRVGQLPPSFNNLACIGTYGNKPYMIQPCRYLPLDGEWPQYGRGEDFDLLISSLLLLFTPEGEVIIPSPSRLYRWYGGSSSFSSSTSPPPFPSSIALVALPLESLEGLGTSPESIAFNTGVMAMVAPRSLTPEGPGCIANVALLISLWQRGWLSSNSTGGSGMGWTLMSPGPRDPGTTTAGAERYIIKLQGSISRAQPPGYPDECSGTATLSITREDGSSLTLAVASVDGTVRQREISNLRVHLYPPGTELCSRAIQGPESNNLLLRHLEPSIPEGCVS